MKWAAKKTLLFLSVGAAALILMGAAGRKDQPQVQKPGIFQYKFLDGNRLNCTVASDGQFCDSRRTGQSGLEWPKGTGKTSVFTAGYWLAGRHRPTGFIRTANIDYSVEYQAGPLLESFNTTTNDDTGPVSRANDARYKLYKIQKNKPDGQSFGNPELDIDPWSDWPGDLGAPYVDVNANGQWDPGVDTPEWKGDQMMWCVVNDVTRSKHAALGATPPMGVEVQILYFVFNQPGPLGDMMFMQWRFINKSDAHYDSTFVAMWSDVDLGEANDDLPGSDSTLSLGYIYNGDNDDGGASGYGSRPPANGFDFFQGPVVPGAPTDSAKFKDKWIKGYRNLPAYAYVVYTNNTFAQIVDPDDGSVEYARQAYDYLLGKAGTVGLYLEYKTGPKAGQRYPPFWFSGDPVAGTGDLPSNFPLGVFNPQDIRVMISTGPFTFAPGDTQEVVGCLLHAQGADRLSSVTLLKRVDAIAQQAFDDNFNVPNPPPVPTVKVAEMPNEIVIDWSEDSKTTEDYVFKNPVYDYRFEGYNLYQGESLNGPWKRLATYDLVNGVTLVEDYVQDPEVGKSYLAPSQYGTDSGLKRYFDVTQDYILGEPLVNGKEYFFALTTYAYNWVPGALELGLTMALENAKDAITIIPKGVPLGTDYNSETGQILTHSRGLDDVLRPEIVDPTRVTGQNYTVAVSGTGAAVTSWSLIRGTADTLVKGSTNFAGDNASPLADGILWRLQNPSEGPRRDTQRLPRGWDYLPSANVWSNGAGTGFQAGGNSVVYPNNIALGQLGQPRTTITPDSIKKVEIRFGGSQKAYRYLKNVTSFPNIPAKDPSFVPFILKRGVGHVYQGDYATVTVPFTVWEVDSLDGDLVPRQLNVGFLENNDSLYTSAGAYVGKGSINGKWEPTTFAETGGLEAIYVFASAYSETEQTKYNTNMLAGNVDMYYIVQVAKRDSASLWKNGDKVVVTPNYVLAGGRTYTVSTQAQAPVTSSPELAKSQMDLVNVFPNPYMGRNAAESGRFNRFVTFTHLPQVATIRVFTITGEIVRTLQHNDNSTFHQWDLRNENALPVASGVYIVHIEVPDVGNRILKLAVVQPEERAARTANR